MIALALGAQLLLRSVAGTDRNGLQYRWVYVQSNLQVEENADKLIALSARAKKAGYNGIVLADTKLQRLASVPEWYFKNARKVIEACRAQSMDLIPCVFPMGYADGMLSNDPNLVEGQTVRGARFRVKGGLANIETNPAEVFRNGGMEEASGDKLAGMGFQDSIGTSTFIDKSIKHSGNQSLRMTDPKVGMPEAGNCRIQQEVSVTPHRQYHLSAWIRTSDFDRASDVAMRVFDPAMKSLTTQDIHVEPTQDWTEMHVTFNSGEASKARIYIGSWGGNKGSLWLDDVKLAETGLLNIIRRPSCPVTVKDGGVAMVEGKDYEAVVDPKMGNVPWLGSFDVFHENPPVKVKAGSRIKEGDLLTVDYDHALITTDNQTAICMSEPKTYNLMAEEAKRVSDLFQPRGLFFSHDEIRAGNQDTTCLARGLDAGAIFADNIRRSFQIGKKALPKGEMYVWNDMFDPFHNAHKDYYNVRGDLTGSWAGLPNDAIIVNWYYSARAKNMPFFAQHGWRQILAGYYDHDPSEIGRWLKDAAGVKGVSGVMYTTWVGNYSDLEKFAQAAWGSSAP